MDSRVVQNQVHENDEHYPHIDASQQVTHGAEEQNFDHEKKSVLNKVKAKAKKIKDTIKKHGHQVLDRGHENNNEDQHTSDDHDLDEDEEIETPSHESEDVKTATPTSEQLENSGKSGIDFGGTTTVEEQPSYEANTDEVVSPKDVTFSEVGSGEKDDIKDIKLDHMLERSVVPESEDIKTATPTSEQVKHLGKSGTEFGGTAGTTVIGEEPGHDAPLGGISSTTEKSEIDQNIATEAYKTFSVDEKAEVPKDNLDRSIGLDEEPHTPGSTPEAHTPNYLTKITDPSDVEKDEIEEITPVEESFAKMNVQDEPKHTPDSNVQPTIDDSEYPLAGNHDQFVPHLSAATQTQYPSAESHDQFNQETISTNLNRNLENPTETGQTFNTITNIVEEKPRYEANTDEVVSSKDVITSEVGSGEKDDIKDKVVATNEEQQKGGDDSTMSGSTAQYGKNIAQSLTQKLTPVYEKVSGVGSAVKSKVTGTSTGGVGTETKNGVKEQNNGVSVKDYLAEKLKPGEEDKALSEVISEALNKPKEEAGKKEDGNLDGRDEKISEESSVNSPGKGMVDKLKGVVGSWFGKSEEKVAGDEDLSKNTNSGAEVVKVNQDVGENKSSPIEEQGTR